MTSTDDRSAPTEPPAAFHYRQAHALFERLGMPDAESIPADATRH
ncbi:hypothetical protein [Kitasatospora sp. HPMI-4]